MREKGANLSTAETRLELAYNGCGLKVVAASKPTNFQPSTNLVGRIHFPKPKTSHPFNLLLAAVHCSIVFHSIFSLRIF